MPLALTWKGIKVAPGPAWAHVGHVETWALPPGDLLLNLKHQGLPSALGAQGEAWSVLDGDRRPDNAWVGEPDASGEIALELAWSAPVRVESLVVTLADDGRHGRPLPSGLRVEVRDGGTWRPALEKRRVPAGGPGTTNRVLLAPVETRGLRIVLASAQPVAVSEVEAYAPGVPALDLSERKFIADDDVLVAVVRARNLGFVPATLGVVATSAVARSADGGLAGTVDLAGPIMVRAEVSGAMVDGQSLVREASLAPGGAGETRVAMSFARSESEARARVGAVLAAADPVAAKDDAAGRWFLGQVPQLDVPDAWFEKTYAFRFEVARRNLTDPRYGRLQHPTFEEGRWAATWFAQAVTYGAPHQLREVRWLRDAAYARGHALTFVDNQRQDGAFVGATVDRPVNEYSDWIASAIWDVYEVTGDRSLLVAALPAMDRNVAYAGSRSTSSRALPVIEDHFETGMEWQPSFFYFDRFDATKSTPLERVDYAAALAANAAAVARAAAVLGLADVATAARAVAESTTAAIDASMWHEPTGFYYSLRARDGAMAMVREVAGYYPLSFGLAPPEHERALKLLFDPAEFWTPWPPASCSFRSPAASQEGWPIGKGGSVAMWNGPTWPHATSMVVEAVARSLRRSGERYVTRRQLFDLLKSYTRAQYLGLDDNRDFSDPMIGEYYDGNRGIWKTGERDYFHSTYADLLITTLIGLDPEAAGVVRISPLVPRGEWNRFLLEGVCFRGHDLTVVWDAPGGEDAYRDGRHGLDLYLDGKLAASRPDLGPLEAPE